MSRVPSLRPDIVSRFIRATNLSVSKEKDCIFRTRLPGFSYDDFDRAGYVSLYKLFRMFETERPILFRFPEFGPRPHQKENEDMMIFGGSFDVSKELYKKAAIDFPMSLTLAFVGYGKSSIDVKITLTSDETNEELASTSRRVVCVNLAKRTSAPVPESFLEEVVKPYMEANNIKPQRYPALTPLKLPEHYFKTSFKVMHDDLDVLFHLNQAVYTKYISNCMAQAAASGFLRHFKDDMCFYLVKSVLMLHKGEAFVGDELCVNMWQDDNDNFMLYFIIRNGDKDIYDAKVQIYENGV